jgi:hypothetical protein
VNAGDRSGQFLNVIDYEETKKTYAILAFPESEPIYIIKKQFEDAISSGLISFVEKVPDDVQLECKKEFLHRTSNK